MKNILILGFRSFVANGFNKLLENENYEVDCFTRAEKSGDNNFIFGDVNEITTNPKFKSEYDVVVNFIILKDKGVDENIEFINNVVEFCRLKNVKRLIHFSSVMVYANNEPDIDETTEVEENTKMTGYGKIKIEVDKYLISLKNLPFKLSLIRPGYVLADNRPCPFVKQLPFGVTIIKGDKKSKQPIVRREDIHLALIKIIRSEVTEPVYLFTPSTNLTKYDYVKSNFKGIILTLPKWLILGISSVLLKLRVIQPSLYVRIEGMYVESIYNSSKTEKLLDIKF